MHNIVLHESIEHGNVAFPFAIYSVNDRHPRYVMEPHWHEECEIVRIISGELKITIDGKTYIGKGNNGLGDIFFINSGSLHSAEPNNCIYECVLFDIHFLLKERSISNSFIYSLLYNQRQFNPHITLQKLEDKDVVNIIDQLFSTLKQKNNGYELKVFGLLYYLLGLLEQKDLYLLPDKVNNNTMPRIMKMRLALSYVHRNYMKQITLNELATLLDLKPPSVVKLFKDLINKKPMEYINSYRIHCAMEMLKDQQNSVTFVAYECGFADVSYFTKVFKKYANLTPRSYIKKLLTNDNLNKKYGIYQ